MRPDGSDQTAHLQAAINAAQTQKRPLFLPPGRFPIATVVVSAPVEIFTAPGGAILHGLGQGPSIHIEPQQTGQRFGPVAIRYLTMDGQRQPFPEGPGGGLIRSDNVDGLVLEGCRLLNSAAQGAHLRGSSGRIRDNIVKSARGVGLYSANAAPQGVVFETNDVRGSGNTGILVTRDALESDRSMIVRNVVDTTLSTDGGNGANGNGINVYRAGNVTVADNKISNSAFSAIRLNASNGSQVLGNYCYKSHEVALYVEAPDAGEPFRGGVVANNVIDDCGGGISVANTNNGGRRVIVNGNQVTNAIDRMVVYPGGSYRTLGRGIEADGDVIVSNNQLESIADWAILAHASNYGAGTARIMSMVMNNMIKTCAGGIAFTADVTSGRIIIGGNIIDAFTTTSRYAAIVPVDWDGGTGVATKISGTPDLGNATSSGFANVKLLQNFCFN